MSRRPTQKFERPETRSSTRSTLAARGISGPSAEAFVDAAARDRHASRVTRFVQAALDEHRKVTDRSAQIDMSPAAVRTAYAYAIAVIMLDTFGVVTPTGPTEATSKIHHRAFREHCGPRTGLGAAATHAAARGAIDQLYAALFGIEHPALPQPQRGCPFITLKPSLSPLGIIVKPSALTAVLLEVEPSDAIDAQPPSWLKTICIEGMRRSLGHAPWFQCRDERRPEPHEATPSPHALDLAIFDGRAEDWAAVLDACIRRERIEEIAHQLVGIISAVRKRAPLCWLPSWKPPRARRISLDYVHGWISMAISDDSKAAPIIELTKTGTADDVRRAFGDALDPECHWIEKHHQDTVIGAGHLKESVQFRAIAVLAMVIDAHASGEDLHMAAAERAMKALGDHGTPVLSPEPSLALHFDEMPGVLLIDDVHPPTLDALLDKARKLCLHVAGLVEQHRGPGLHVAGARVIGTAAEWYAAADGLVRVSAGSSRSRGD